ncbi:MAG: hypothetical protein WC010_03595 [Candidatus Absconditabacterales bacterium]
MAITPNKNLELVSAQNQVKSKKDQMLENLKLEMIKDLKLDQNLIKRNELMGEISKTRENTFFPAQINFGGKIIEIKEQGKYKTLVAQYKKINTENSIDKEEILKQLDKELSEQIILDQKKMILFEGKTAEEETKLSFERLDKNNKYNKKIELIKKTNGEVTHFVIKRTEAQIKELERAERAYEALHGGEVKETEKSQATKGLQSKISTLQKSPEIINTKDKKIIPTPIEEEEKEFESMIEHTSTISDTTKITRAIAEREAGEKLRKIYKNTTRYKPRSWPTKAALFVGRGYMKDYYTRKYMKMKGGMQRDENLVKGADRHAMELENNFKNIDKLATIDETNYPETYKEIQIIKDELIQGAINEDTFRKDFKSIIEDKTLDASNPVSNIIKENNIQQMSSNVAEDVLAFRDHQKLVKEITKNMFQNPAIAAGDPVAEKNFNIFARERIIEYFKTYQKNPTFLKTLNIKFDDKDAMKKLSNYQAHNGALTMIAKQTMMLKVQILAKGEEAYDVKQEVKGFRGTMTKAGDRLDKPISDTSRFGKWLEKHPFAKNAFGTLRGVTKLGAIITPAILLAPLGPLAVAGGVGTMAFVKTFIKKHAHYNKEHVGYQRNQAVNLMENRNEREKLMNEISKMNPATRFMLYHFGFGKKARDVRQFKDYIMTTHDQLKNSKELTNSINDLLTQPELDGTKPRQLEDLIGQALARLNFHKKTGQNFLGSENKDEAEKEYQTIYRLVLSGAMRLDKKLDEFETTRTYKREMDLINNGTGNEVNEIGYQKSRKRFKYRQTEKSLVGAAKAGGLAFGLSYLATSLASTDTSSHTVSDKGNIGENFMLGKHELAGDNNLYTQSKEFFGTPNAGHQTINFQYGGGTDATHVLSGHLTQSEYLTKVVDVQKEILQMTNISEGTKINLINEIHNKPREQVRTEKGFTNDYLQGMRCVEGLEQTAKALNDSGVNSGTITLNAAYNGSAYDIVGQTYNNAGERIVQGALNYSQTIATPENIIPIPIPAYINTFKRADRNDILDINTPPTKDKKGRKTKKTEPDTEEQSDYTILDNNY